MPWEAEQLGQESAEAGSKPESQVLRSLLEPRGIACLSGNYASTLERGGRNCPGNLVSLLETKRTMC